MTSQILAIFFGTTLGINIFQKFKDGLKKTTSNFSKGIKDIVVNKEIDDKTLEEIEEFLIQSDVGG